MQPIKHDGSRRASVHAALQGAPAEGFLAHVARRLLGGAERPLLVEFSDDMAAQARRLALRAPPHVLYPVIANIRLPRPVALVELPAGEALYAEMDDGRVCVCVLRTDGGGVTFQPLCGAVRPPAERPEVDWDTLEMEAWSEEAAADAGWAAWAESNIEAAPLRGTPRPTGAGKERLLQAYVLPSLVALSLLTSPLAEAEPTFWLRKVPLNRRSTANG